MGADITLAKAIIEIGAKGVTETNAEIGMLQASMNTLETEYKQGKVGIVEYAAEAGKMRAKIADLKSTLDLAESSLKKYGTQQAALDALNKQATGSTRNLGMGFLELSRAFEDAQYGLRGVLNNIPTTIQMFGGPAGLAAGVSIAAVAFSMIQPKVQAWIDSMGLFQDETKKARDEIGKITERIEELEKKPTKLAVDMIELDQAKAKLDQLRKDQAAYNALKEGKTVFEKEAGEQFKANFDASGQQGVEAKDQVRGQITTELLAQSKARKKVERLKAELEQRMQEATEGATSLEDLQSLPKIRKAFERQIKAAEEEARKATVEIIRTDGEAERKTGNLFSRAGAGNDQEGRDELVRRLRAAGQANLANTLALSTPEEMERQEREEAAFQRKEEAAKRAKAEARAIDQRAAHNLANDPDAQREHNDRLRNLARAPMSPEMAGKSLGVDPDVYRRELREGKELLAKDAAKAQNADKAPTPVSGAELAHAGVKRNEQIRDQHNDRAEENLARQVFAGSEQATGMQFTPDQARSVAHATREAVQKGVNFNAALQGALQHEVQAMAGIAMQLDQQQQAIQQIGFGFQNVLRQMRMNQARQRTAQKRN